MADNITDKLFGFLGFVAASIVFRTLGKDQWSKASGIRADDGRKP
jgi:hypothetical protein